MEQFAVHRNPNPEFAERAPYLLVLQSDLLRDLATVVVAPLIEEGRFGKPATVLNPVFEIEGNRVVLSVTELAGISRRDLGGYVTSLGQARQELIAAIDLLFTGI